MGDRHPSQQNYLAYVGLFPSRQPSPMHRQTAGFVFRQMVKTQSVEPSVGLGQRLGGGFIQMRHLARPVGSKPLQSLRTPDFWMWIYSQQRNDLVCSSSCDYNHPRMAGVHDLGEQDGHTRIGISLITVQLERGQGPVIVEKQRGLARQAEFVEEFLQIGFGVDIEHVHLLWAEVLPQAAERLV